MQLNGNSDINVHAHFIFYSQDVYMYENYMEEPNS